jgi:transposase
MIAMRERGMSHREIAATLDRTPAAISQCFRKLGLTRRGVSVRSWTDSAKQRLADLVGEGLKYRDIAARMGRSWRSVEGMITRLNLRRPKPKLADEEPRLSRSELAIWRRQIKEESHGLSRSELAIWRVQEAR